VEQLLEAIEQKYDIVHRFCEVSRKGMISDGRGGTIAGTSLTEKCCGSDVKLLWAHPGLQNGRKAYKSSFDSEPQRLEVLSLS
jgi:hypothetical protein